MTFINIHISKNEKKTAENHPDLRLNQVLPNAINQTNAKGGMFSSAFVEIGAAWRSKSGKGYNAKVDLSKIIHDGAQATPTAPAEVEEKVDEGFGPY